MGVFERAMELDLPVIDFDAGPWMDVILGEKARWWTKVGYHKSLKEFDKLVFLPCMKHHFSARFTMGLEKVGGKTRLTHFDVAQPKIPWEVRLEKRVIDGG